MKEPGKNLLAANDLAIKAAVARNRKQTEYRIAGVAGLTLRVEPSGKAAYYVRYSVRGALKRVRIGGRDTMTWREARGKALDLAGAIDRGDDPVAIALQRADSLTVRELWEERKKLDTERAARTMRYYDEVLHKYAFAELGDIPSDELTTDQVAALLRKVQQHSKHVAHAVRCALGSTYRWAYSRRLVRSNPTIGLGFIHAPKPRKREVEADEIGKLWLGIETASGLTTRMRIALKLLLLTGVRNSAVAGAAVSELKSIDAANPTWRIPAELAREGIKNKERDHLVPLSPLAVSLFQEALAKNNGSAFVFPTEGKGDGHFGRHSISHAMAKLRTKAGIDDLRVQDFRKGMTTWFAENGIGYDVRSRIMHHTPPDITSRAYDFSMLNGPMRDALGRWEKYVLECAERAGKGEAASVMPMPSRA